MIKGLSHRVIVVKSPNKLFEEAIFVIRDDVLTGKGADSAAIMREAARAANSYVGKRQAPKPKGFLSLRLPAPLLLGASAAAAGLTWLALRLCGT